MTAPALGRRLLRALTRVLALGAALSAFLASLASAAVPHAVSWRSAEITFAGQGSGVMLIPNNDQVYRKALSWRLEWKVRPGPPVQGLLSEKEEISGGTSQFTGTDGIFHYDPKTGKTVRGGCKGGVEKTPGQHALIFGFYPGGIPPPAKKGGGLTVKGFPNLLRVPPNQPWSAIQVPIFGNLATACFGSATMAVSYQPTGHATSRQVDVGIINAIFPFNPLDPKSGDYSFKRVWLETYRSNAGFVRYKWSGTIAVVVK